MAEEIKEQNVQTEAMKADPLTELFIKKLEKYEYLNQPGFEAKKEQLRLMLVYGFSDRFIDRFFNSYNHGYVNCHADELDKIRMAAVFAGAGNGAEGEKYILAKLEKDDFGLEEILLELNQQYVDANIRQLPVIFQLKQELDYLRRSAEERNRFGEEKMNELIELRKSYAFLEGKLKEHENTQNRSGKYNEDCAGRFRPLIIETEDKMDKVIPIVIDLKECLDEGQVSFLGRRVCYREPVISRSKLLALQSLGMLQELQSILGKTHTPEDSAEAERQKYIMKTICSPMLSQDQISEFIEAAEHGMPLYALKYLGEAPIPKENMKVMKEYLSRRGGLS